MYIQYFTFKSFNEISAEIIKLEPEEGKLLYTNQAGTFIKNQWGIELGDNVPIEIVSHSKLNDSSPLEMEVGNKIFSFHVVPVVEFGFVNLYATDITAAKAITKFPDQNPNNV